MLTTMLCRYEHFLTDWHAAWSAALGYRDGTPPEQLPADHFQRKIWEWCAIAQALAERDMLRPGRRGIGFAVGRERLPALFAAHGVAVLATDQPAASATTDWGKLGEHAANREALFHGGVCGRAAFDAGVQFEPVDMRRLDGLARGGFDFAWSACALEHLGTLEAGLAFVRHSAALLRPGGVAVHTTEFNVSSDTATVAAGDAVIYRRQDLERLDRRLRLQGSGLARLDLFAGDHPYDLAWDYPPFFSHGRPHLKLLLDGFVATSALLIVQKGEAVGEAESDEDAAQPAEAGHAPREDARLRGELALARAALDAMRRSRSWRVTAPLRAVGAALRRR